jgi:hypothetical protein
VKILLWVLAGILVFDAVMVVVVAVCAVFARHRAPKVIGRHQVLLGLGPPDRARVGSRPRLLLRRGEGQAASATPDDRRMSIHLVRPADDPASRASHRRSSRRRIVASVLAAAVLFAGTALASPAVRQVVATAFDAVASGFGAAPSTGDGQAPGTGVGASSQPGSGQNASPAPQGTAAAGTGSTDAPGVAGPTSGASHPAASPDIVVSGPASPSSVMAVPGSSSRIDVSWTDVQDETGYRVERSADGSSGWETVATTGQDVVSSSDAGLPSGTTFYYRIFATNADGDSPPSGVASATTTIDPASPTTLRADPGSAAEIVLTWTDVGDETGYRVERSADGSSGWETIVTTGQDVTTYSDAGLPSGTTFYYRIFATNGGGDSPPSDVASATTAPSGGSDPTDGATTP